MESAAEESEGPGRRFRLDEAGLLTWLNREHRQRGIVWKYGDSPRLWTDFVSIGHHERCLAAANRIRSGSSTQECLVTRSSWGSDWVRWYLCGNTDGPILGHAFDASEEQQTVELHRIGVEASPTGLLIVDPRGTIVMANHQVEAMFGYTRSELLGSRVEILLPKQLRERHPALMASFFRMPASRAMGQGRDLFGARKDGSEFAIEIGLNPARIGTATFVLASIVDTSARKLHEAERQERMAELQQYQRETGVLSEMSSLLQHATTLEEAHQVVAAFGKELLACSDETTNVAIYTARSSQDALELRSTWGKLAPPKRFAIDDCWALRRWQTHQVSQNEGSVTLPRCSHSAHEGWQMCIPMAAQGQATGLISIYGSRDVGASERSDLERAAKAVADQLALAVSNLSLRESLRQMAIRDPLTGLFNRRHMEDSVARELARAKRNGWQVSVWMLDIDHFKRFNDTHGHQAADEALADFGQHLQNGIRESDIGCRFGGEEFVAVLPDCGKEEAVHKADAFRRSIKKSNLGITVSIGVAEFPQDGGNWQTVLRAADLALYGAKAAGRNCVQSAVGIGSGDDGLDQPRLVEAAASE